MADYIQAPRGTLDILPEKVAKWQHIEKVIRDTARLCGFAEIRFPTFEYTELFSRGVGETTDVVQKEMYTFEDRGGRSITLRPEGTAPTVRAVLQNSLNNGPLPVKLYYIISCFRGERPQAGRLREIHQFGAELFGAGEQAFDGRRGPAGSAARRAFIHGLELRADLRQGQLRIGALDADDERHQPFAAELTAGGLQQGGIGEALGNEAFDRALQSFDAPEGEGRWIARVWR